MSDERTVWQLARMAECADPDAPDSPGAKWLENVAASFEPEYLNARYPDDSLHEWADGCVPIYTHERWRVFVDLAAYEEDVSELTGGTEQDMTTQAGIALYMIAERILRALLDEHNENENENDDD